MPKDFDDYILKVEIEGLPPSVNQIWRKSRRGMYKTKEATDFERLAILRTRTSLRGRDFSVMRKHPIRLEIDLCLPTWKVKSAKAKGGFIRRDLSNFIKVVEDAVFKACELDDCAVCELLVRKVESEFERTMVRMNFIEEGTDDGSDDVNGD